jgi:hypothetical protein
LASMGNFCYGCFNGFEIGDNDGDILFLSALGPSSHHSMGSIALFFLIDSK